MLKKRYKWYKVYNRRKDKKTKKLEGKMFLLGKLPASSKLAAKLLAMRVNRDWSRTRIGRKASWKPVIVKIEMVKK